MHRKKIPEKSTFTTFWSVWNMDHMGPSREHKYPLLFLLSSVGFDVVLDNR